MTKPLLYILSLLLISATAGAQDFKFGTFTQQEVVNKTYPKDTSAHAYVINEYGESKIDVTSDDNIKVIHEYHVKIKILDAKGFKKGDVVIPIYTGGEVHEAVDNIKGVTTYRDETGGIQQSELDITKVFNVKETNKYTNVKFAMPNIRPGAIIEYSYRWTSPYIYQYPSWQFQDNIPKMASLYEVHIPGFWTYNASLRGALPLNKNTSELERSCFTTHGASCDCSHIIYGMQDIPAFVEEDYMTSAKNYISAITFQLSDYINPYTGQKIKVTKEWKDVDYNLKKASYFGTQLKRKDLLKKLIEPAIAGKTDEIAKAKAVYAYIQKNLKWNNIRSRGSEDGVRKALEAHTGNAGDINIALVTAMNAAGLNCEAVLLSTRSNGLVNKLYPVEDEFDYVIAKLNIGENSYLLDATDPLLGFNMLPMRCLNDQGRVMSLDKPSYWIDLSPKQRQTSTSQLDLTLQSNGKLKGTITTYSSGYEAYDQRKAIRKFNSTDEYVEDLDEKMTKIKILSSEITNLDSLDLPLGEKYEVEIDAFDNLNHTRLSFNPFILNRISSNPFKLEERSYPVDWGMPSDERFMLTVHLPADYVVESAPKGTALTLPNAGGKFITDYNADGSVFTVSNVLQFNKSIYATEEYPYLKEMYNKIIAAEKADIVFKKK